jgi:hypothetical protein
VSAGALQSQEVLFPQPKYTGDSGWENNAPTVSPWRYGTQLASILPIQHVNVLIDRSVGGFTNWALGARTMNGILEYR